MPSTTSRRRFLAAVGGAIGVSSAGCAANDTGDPGDDTDAVADRPTFGRDGGNTNYSPHGAAPTDSPAERWRVERSRASAQPVIADGTVYAPVGADVLAIDADSGEVMWSVDPENDATIYWAPPTVRDGVVYLGDGDERLRAFDAEDGALLWERRFDGDRFEGIYGAPTVGVRGLSVGTAGGRVYTLDPATGETVWRTSVFGRIESTLASDPPLLYAVTSGGDVYTFGSGGRGHWHVGLPGLSSSTPAAVDGRCYVGCHDGAVYALADGAVEWTTEVGGFASGGLAVADGRLFVAGGAGLMVLDAESGRVRWSSTVGSDGETPVVVDETAYVGGDGLYGMTLDGGIGLGAARVGGCRFALSVPNGVRHVAAGGGLLVASVGRTRGGSDLVAFE